MLDHNCKANPDLYLIDQDDAYALIEYLCEYHRNGATHELSRELVLNGYLEMFDSFFTTKYFENAMLFHAIKNQNFKLKPVHFFHYEDGKIPHEILDDVKSVLEECNDEKILKQVRDYQYEFIQLYDRQYRVDNTEQIYSYLMELNGFYAKKFFSKSVIKKDIADYAIDIQRFEDNDYGMPRVHKFKNFGYSYEYPCVKEQWFEIPRLPETIGVSYIESRAKDVAKIIKDYLIENVEYYQTKWVSEFELYINLKNCFPDLSFVRHHSFEWLGRQHIDIYVPQFRIAIERQGRQHFESVDFFGGDDGLKETQKRDKLKRQLCKNNDVILLEHRYDEDFDKLVNKINSIIQD